MQRIGGEGGNGNVEEFDETSKGKLNTSTTIHPAEFEL